MSYSENLNLELLFNERVFIENSVENQITEETDKITEDRALSVVDTVEEIDNSEMNPKSEFSVEKLRGGDNFHDWSFAIENLMTMKGYANCITAKTDDENTAKEADEGKLGGAKALLVLSMETSLYPHIRKCQSALAIWKLVHNMFEDKGHWRRADLFKKLVQNRLESCDSMESYVGNTMTLIAKLDSVGLQLNDELSVALLMAGLSEKFNPFLMGLKATKITFDELKLKLLDTSEECAGSEALLSKSKQGKKKKPFQKKRRCYTCDSPTHLSNKCPEGKGKKESKSNVATASENANNAFCAFLGTATDKSVWFVDSGASNHMTPNGAMIEKKRECDITHIVAANNEKIPVDSVGTTKISAETDIMIEKVLHVPGLAANLLSVSKIVEKGNSVLFNRDGCKIMNQQNEVIAKCKPSNGVYRLEAKNMCLSATEKTTAFMWHRKLGHLNLQTLLKMKKDPSFGISFDDMGDEIKNCEVCARGKQTRLPFKASVTETENKLDLIHSDLVGPMENTSYGNAKYMLTLVDDFSRMSFLYFIRDKSQVLEKFIEFKNVMENQTGHKIKIFRTDNGGEYCGKDFDRFCAANGIIHQLTAPHTPEQNGVAERMNRTIVEKARCLLFDADLNLRAWAEACNMASYIRNRTLTRTLNFKAPIEVWTGEKADMRKMKLFGSTVMVHVPKASRKKWSDKSTKMVFVGYDTRAKAYRCLNTKSNKVIVSRDVIFHNASIPNQMPIEIEENATANTPQGVPNLVQDQQENGNNATERDHSIDMDENQDNTPFLEEDDTIVASPSNNVDLNGTVATLGNNTSNDTEFEDALDNEMAMEETINDENDKTFRTRAKVDVPTTPRKGSRVRKQYVPFQLVSLALICTEPMNEVEALESEESTHWKKAMDEEMSSHQKNGTWKLVDLPQNARAIAGKWVFKRKTNANGEIIRHKARFVAKGFAQRHGRDYYETFSPVVRHATIRYLLALAVKKRMKIHQMDAETAFLQGDLHEDVYMRQAPAYDDQSGRVYHLKKAIYGLKQASRMWNIKLNNVLITFGFKRSKTDPCVYRKGDMLIAVYVDDFLIFYHQKVDLEELRKMLHQNFNMKDIGLARSCLGITITQGADFIQIDQSHYVKEVLDRFGMTNCKSAPTPSDVNQKLSVTMWTEENSLVGKVPYQELIGSLLYLSGATRPDIAFAVNDLSRFNDKHSEPHWKALKRVVRYLKGTADLKLTYKRGEENDMTAYSDADWGADIDKRRSCTGYVVNMSGGAISWCSQRQSIVALSSTEAEYIALSTTVREIIWLQQLSGECDRKKHTVVTHCDNQSAIDLGEIEAYRPRTKHIDIRFHHIRDRVQKGTIELEYTATERMIADSLTKPVTKEKTQFCRIGMGLSS